jgi:hypothetical protein
VRAALYMAALAFTAYGVHWWALGMGAAGCGVLKIYRDTI